MPQNAPPATLPPFYDDLALSYAEAWQMLTGGAADRRHAIHTITIATIAPQLVPRLRTVVLREVDATRRELRFHTDRRSAKYLDLALRPAIEVLAYDAEHKIQLRLSGRARLHSGDIIAQAAWRFSRPQSRECYRQAAIPGTLCDNPAAAAAPGDCNSDGFANFAAVIVEVQTIEWLYLSSHGHRRALFSWDAHGATVMNWLAV